MHISDVSLHKYRLSDLILKIFGSFSEKPLINTYISAFTLESTLYKWMYILIVSDSTYSFYKYAIHFYLKFNQNRYNLQM